MKKIITTTLLLCMAVVALYAQNKGGGGHDQRMQEIQSMKIAFMTDFLKLTPAESEKFWPVYNKYWGERMQLAHSKRDLYRKIESETATESQLTELCKLSFDEAKLVEKYANEIARVLNVDRSAKVFVADEKFKGMLLKRTQGWGGK